MTLCVLVASFPYSIAINRITIIVLVANWLFEGDYKRKWSIVRSDTALLALIAFYLLHVVSLLYTSNLGEGNYQLEKKISYLAFAVVIVTSLPLSRKQFDLVLKVLVLAVIVASIVCLGYAFHRNHYLETFRDPVWFYWTYYDFTEIIGVQPNYLALLAGFAIISGYYFLIEYGSAYTTWKKILMYALIAYLGIFLVLLSGRTSLVAMAFIVGAGYLWYFYKTGRLLRGLLAVSILVVALVVVVYQVPIMKERMLQTFGFDEDLHWINQMGDGKGGLPSVRLMKWQGSWNIIKDNWLFGISPGDTQDALQEQYKKLDFTLGFEEHYNPHNQYLQTWVALGIVGLLVFLATLYIPLRKAIKQTDYIYIAFIAMFAICFLTESILERQVGIIFYALFNALLLQRQNNEQR